MATRTELRERLTTMLARKEDIDRRNKEAGTNMVSFDFWLRDAVELLLRAELERPT